MPLGDILIVDCGILTACLENHHLVIHMGKIRRMQIIVTPIMGLNTLL
jgi:hypothetical protein